MSLINGLCCCDEVPCEELGAMCICEATQDYSPGCYENVTAVVAEEEGGLWGGAGSTCLDFTGCAACCANDADIALVLRKKCCFPTRIKTDCNEYVIDPCAKLNSEMLTKCECDALGGDWGVIGPCNCNDDPLCVGYGCCPPTAMPPATTGLIEIIKGVYTKNVYIEIIPECPGTYNYTYHEFYIESNVNIIDASQYAAYVAALNSTDYNYTCPGDPACPTGQTYLLSGTFIKVTSIAAVMVEPCLCEDVGGSLGCPQSCVCNAATTFAQIKYYDPCTTPIITNTADISYWCCGSG